MDEVKIRIDRAPVLTLWAAVVAECLGFDRLTALTLGQAVAAPSAYAKGASLGIIEPRPDLMREAAGRGRQFGLRPPGPSGAGDADADGLRAVNKASLATRRSARSTSPASSVSTSSRRG